VKIDTSLSGKRQLPLMMSTELAECGLACLAMVSGYYGHQVDLATLRQRFPQSLSGLTLPGLIGLAKRLELATRPLRVDLEALTQLRVPTILHWDLNHYVVLKEVQGNTVVIHDPSTGAQRLPLTVVSDHFTGVALEVWPTADFTALDVRRPLSLTSLWHRSSGIWGSMARVLALTLVLQLVALTAPIQLQLVVDQGVQHSDESLLYVLAAGFLVLALFQATVDFLRTWCVQSVGALFSFQAIANIVRHLFSLPIPFFEKRHIGDILSRMQSANAVQEVFTKGMVTGFLDGVMAIGALAILLAYDLRLAAIAAAAVGLNLGLTLLAASLTRRGMHLQLQAAAEERTHLMESIRAIRVLRLMGRESEREQIWSNLYATSLNRGLEVGRRRQAFTSAQLAVDAASTAALLLAGGLQVIRGEGLTVGMLLAVMAYKQILTDRSRGLLTQVIELRYVSLHLERLSDIVATTREEVGLDPESAVTADQLDLLDVSFRYGESDRTVLSNVTLSVRRGEYLAITGASGSGKSTLLKVMLGLQSPTGGEVRLDGTPATPGIWQAWRRHIGVVSQDDVLLSGTIAENIAFSRDVDLPKVKKAAERAQVRTDIERMPMRYLTPVGDMGAALSGGQRQRILLARALYQDPDWLFLDEGTANIDQATEHLLADLISSLPCTRIVIAHRPALIARADRVYSMEEGRLRVLPPSGMPHEVIA
jgi:ATP-binding cassette subfamily B protein RaxB